MNALGIAGVPGHIAALGEAGAGACLTNSLDFALMRREIEPLLASIEA